MVHFRKNNKTEIQNRGITLNHCTISMEPNASYAYAISTPLVFERTFTGNSSFERVSVMCLVKCREKICYSAVMGAAPFWHKLTECVQIMTAPVPCNSKMKTSSRADCESGGWNLHGREG